MKIETVGGRELRPIDHRCCLHSRERARKKKLGRGESRSEHVSSRFRLVSSPPIRGVAQLFFAFPQISRKEGRGRMIRRKKKGGEEKWIKQNANGMAATCSVYNVKLSIAQLFIYAYSP